MSSQSNNTMPAPSTVESSPDKNRNHTNKRGKKRHAPQKNNWQSRRGRPRRHYATKDPPPAKPTCSECQAQAPKYKCPKCRAPYCSIACCRNHKEKSCSNQGTKCGSQKQGEVAKSKYLLPSDKTTVPSAPQLPTDKNLFEDFEEGWRITQKMKDAMDQSPWLKDELQDGGLRQIVLDILHGNLDSQQAALEQVKKQRPNFATFMDKLLVITGVLERQQSPQQEELEEWLMRTNHDDLGTLVMNPMERKQRQPQEQTKSLCEASSSGGDSSSSDDCSSDSRSSDNESDT